MHRQSVARLTRQCHGLPLVELPPPYLAPSLHFSLIRTPVQCSSFSSTAVVAGRGRDLNKTRGVSAIHRTGPRFKLGVSKYPLPKPVSPAALEKREATPDHGLWGFFPRDRSALSTPEYDIAHGSYSPTWFSPLFLVDIGFANCGLSNRPFLVHPRTSGEVVGRPSLSLVGLCQGA
jgi:large subunit ribosomal protein L47